jgi:hypothetical protein
VDCVPRGIRLIPFALVIAAWGATPAAAQQPVAPYDGSIPFNCELQYVGTGTDYPDPDADPFCVEYDKTQQNVTDLGAVEFLLQEPTRLLALIDDEAGTKCFYFQRDHWTGSLIQGQPPEIWNWDGNYWIDRARGVGGGSLRNLRFLGQPMDATPFVPAGYQEYVDEGGGFGAQFVLETDPDPQCYARIDTPEERGKIYSDAPVELPCVPPGGRLRGKRVGQVRLGMKRERVFALLGAPHSRKRRVDRWCVIGAAVLRIAYRRNRVALIKTTVRGHDLRDVAPGTRARRARRRLGEPAFRAAGAKVIVVTGKRRIAYAGLRGRRVRWLAVAKPGLNARRTLKRAR